MPCKVAWCGTCQRLRPKEEFHRSASRCKPCQKTHAAKLYLAHKERYRERNRAYAENNRDHAAAARRLWAQKNAELIAEKDRVKRQRNKARYAHYASRRRAAELMAMPAWANEFFIEEAYELSALRTAVTGIKWSVDHIIPLRSRVVCGLHVHENLRVIPLAENVRKNNSFLVGWLCAR